jgi:hypothetical protein
VRTKYRYILIAITVALTVMLVAPALAAPATGNSAFERTWSRTDLPVIEQRVNRTWMWGPAPITGPLMEATTDRPGVGREVQYFDKSRMERSLDPSLSEYSIWYVTNGLLARELVTGELQSGDNTFEQRSPASVNVAGDWDDPTGPTYASFAGLLGAPSIEQGSPVTWRVGRDGSVQDDPSLSSLEVFGEYYVPETQHTIASPFWTFMNSSGLVQESGPPRNGALFPNPFYATGFPISEAYWANVKVGNVYTDVLIQVFERRVLTYTPGNPDGWQVEAGNVGRHYFEWRYGVSPPAMPGAPPRGHAPLGPLPLAQSQVLTGDAAIELANAGATPLTVRIEGTTSFEVTLDGCPECEPQAPVSAACSASAPAQTIEIPAGSYVVTVDRPGGVQPLAGVWTFLPGSQHGACFFLIR